MNEQTIKKVTTTPAPLKNLQKELDKDVENGGFPTDNGGSAIPEVDVSKTEHQTVKQGNKEVAVVADTVGQAMTEDAARMKKILWAQPIIPFFIPCGEGEKPMVSEEIVQINGYKLTIKKGVMVNLPQQVVQMLADHLMINQGNTAVGAEHRLDRDQRTLDALS